LRAHVRRYLFYLEFFAGGNLVLLAAGFYDRVHERELLGGSERIECRRPGIALGTRKSFEFYDLSTTPVKEQPFPLAYEGGGSIIDAW
jgi:hypothetical protein